MAQKNAYVVLDTETSIRDGLVFDFGWTTITAKGEILGECSLNFLDVLCVEKPYYHNKIARDARDQRNLPNYNNNLVSLEGDCTPRTCGATHRSACVRYR